MNTVFPWFSLPFGILDVFGFRGGSGLVSAAAGLFVREILVDECNRHASFAGRRRAATGDHQPWTLGSWRSEQWHSGMLARNVVFYSSAAAAERAGYRPCFRCRPETAPFCPAWKGTRTTVERALALIETGALDNNSVDALAARLGIGARHLSRLFAEHLDASPVQVAQSLRIQRAKRLLDETDLPIAVVAGRAGFSSPRRMTAAFVRVYGRNAIHLDHGKMQRQTSRRRTTHDRVANDSQSAQS